MRECERKTGIDWIFEFYLDEDGLLAPGLGAHVFSSKQASKQALRRKKARIKKRSDAGIERLRLRGVVYPCGNDTWD